MDVIILLNRYLEKLFRYAGNLFSATQIKAGKGGKKKQPNIEEIIISPIKNPQIHQRQGTGQ
uniref:hypothetical protein n=1 Tax=Candidatus Electrothrix sp. TaxID=2170559 RepID=UPI004057A9C3